MSNIVIGIDLGEYTSTVSTRQIVLSDLGDFVPTIEGLLYVYNYTQDKQYFAQAESFGKMVTITEDVDVDGKTIYILEYDDQPSYYVLGANDIIHIQFWVAVNNENPTPTKDVDGAGRNSLNSVFGEKVTGLRRADIAAQFQYGFPVGSAKPEIANGGTLYIAESMLTLSTGTNVAGLAAISNKKALRYLPGHEAYLYFTAIFTEGTVDSHQRAGLFDSENGFFIGYEGSDFCVSRRRDGVDFNQAINILGIYIDGTFDPTKGNVYRISFGYLGFATIHFEVMTPTGGWVTIYEIEYPNSSEGTHVLNTNLQPRLEVENTGNNTDIIAKTGSFSAGIINGAGEDPAARRFTYSQFNITRTATIQNIITFRSRSTFNSLTNYIQTLFSLMSIATDLSKNSGWEFRKGMTITNTPTWIDINTLDSTIEYSTDAVLTAGTGSVDLAFTMEKTDRMFEKIESEEIELFPEETMTLVIYTPLGTNGTFDLALRWKELF